MDKIDYILSWMNFFEWKIKYLSEGIHFVFVTHNYVTLQDTK